MAVMDQITLGLDPLPKKTRKEVFLDEMNQVVPWAALVALIQPHARGAHQALGGRPPFAVETMLRIHCLQLWWNLSDPAAEEELHERPLYRRFVGLDGASRMPDETTILRFRHLLEKHQLAPQVLAIINAGLAQHGLMLKTVGPKPILEDALQQVEGIERAAIYGSWARRYRGQAGPEPQDIDLLVVGEPDVDRLRAIVDDAAKTLGRDVNPTVLTKQEWARSRSGFITQLHHDELVELDIHSAPERSA